MVKIFASLANAVLIAGCGFSNGSDPTPVNPCATGENATYNSNIEQQCAASGKAEIQSQSGAVSVNCDRKAGVSFICMRSETYKSMCEPHGVKSIQDTQSKNGDKIYYFKQVECQSAAGSTPPAP